MHNISRQEFARVKEHLLELDSNQKLMQQQLSEYKAQLKSLTMTIEKMASSEQVIRQQDQLHQHLAAMERRISQEAEQRDDDLKQLLHWKRDRQAVGRAGGWLLSMLPSIVTLVSLLVAAASLWSRK